MLYTRELVPERWDDFEAYFSYQGSCSGCWCMNHRMPMGLDIRGEAAKLAMKQLILSKRVFGLLAYQDSDPVPVGWCSLDRRNTLPGHDCIADNFACDDGIWSVHCITARRDSAKAEVIKKLSADVIDLAKKYQAVAVEVYPEPGSSHTSSFATWNVFNGYEDTFTELGFHPLPTAAHEPFYRPMQRRLPDERA